jgi:uncharacterized RDD family membrane protein YckC
MEYQNYSANPNTDIFQEPVVSYGNFGGRFCAWLIDTILLIFPSYLIQYVFFSGTEGLLVSALVSWLYHAGMQSAEGQATLGKKAMGLRVTDLDGNRISFGRATGRFFGQYISGLILGIGYLMMLWDDKKQTLHDQIANTLVIKNRTSW